MTLLSLRATPARTQVTKKRVMKRNKSNQMRSRNRKGRTHMTSTHTVLSILTHMALRQVGPRAPVAVEMVMAGSLMTKMVGISIHIQMVGPRVVAGPQAVAALRRLRPQVQATFHS